MRAIVRACIQSEGENESEGNPTPDASEVGAETNADADADVVRKYVTHLLYLEGEGVPKVDKVELARLGVDCVRVYGRKVDGMLRYDEAGLTGALEALVGKAEMVRSRRNTSGQ